MQALNAFRQMGTNADPVLVAALNAKDNPLAKTYRGIHLLLPQTLQQRLPQPYDPLELNLAASFVVLNYHESTIVLKLLPLLRLRATDLRTEILSAVQDRIGPADAGQIPAMLVAATDPSFTVREELMVCLGRIGRSATNAVPTIVKLCSDEDVDVRMEAAWALWNITGQTNIAAPVLESASPQNQLAHRRRLAAILLSQMEHAATNSP
jgi:HEAT repeat protein